MHIFVGFFPFEIEWENQFILRIMEKQVFNREKSEKANLNHTKQTDSYQNPQIDINELKAEITKTL